MIVMIDNYDSFTFNLVQMIESISAERVSVMRNDAFEPDELLQSTPLAIVVSPGPGVPSRAGRIVELIRRNETVPLLGVCLGHQAIGEAFGAAIVRGPLPVHGKVTPIEHEARGLFEECPRPMRAARYHSLVVDRSTLPPELEITATADGIVMGIAHRSRPIYGIQFHPESYGTSGGEVIIRNFLRLAAEEGR
ncbi:MAG TPA: aminodeoxychorismate/anthranilate synthase component II [Thermoanaerobaculia bacterium]